MFDPESKEAAKFYSQASQLGMLQFNNNMFAVHLCVPGLTQIAT